ncbi:uncharacterized protein DUF445 [Hypnocyclicus thermotrophus]|uniref:Uncharacterized protein DUF445 n=1 Tax=Hypnocyclicus thermotrophus TaxID=1627895 RepID=A0AA46DY75_9FUSO|nr:DUF445 family protein [Hypnocyclicus thermotrophus]TDT69773.1 uncharacterized protein DUF445 [Hypnocyclicus thermotrophus]
MQGILSFFTLIIIASLIGWFTNFVAIKLLFKPYEPINLGFFKLQGVIPKRREEIAINIAETIDRDLISMKDITKTINSIELEDEIDKIVDDIVEKKLKDDLFKNIPMIAMFVNDSMISKIKGYIKDVIEENKEELVNIIIHKLENEIDFKEIIVNKINQFSLEEVEKMTINIAKKELKHIELIGAILGAIIGVVQFLLIQIM